MAGIKMDSEGNRLFKGERERKDGRYEYRYINHMGRNISVYAARLNQLRLEEAKIAYKEQISILYEAKELILNDVYELWVSGKVDLKENTLSGYKRIYDSYVRNNLGKRIIEEIKTADVKAFYIRLKMDRSLSVATICGIQNVLFQIFQYAVDNDVIWKNPANRAAKEIKRSHSKHSSNREGIGEEDANLLLDFIYKTPVFRDWYPIIYVCINTGLRLCELISLRWCDINFSENYIDVTHNVTYYARAGEHAKYHLSEGTKTIAGNRKVPFDKKVAAAFEMERKILKEKRIGCNQIIDGYTDFVFLNKDGKIFNQTSINRALSRIVDAYNGYVEREGLENRVLPHLTTHCLRHSYAIILCERGVNVKVMQMLLGHKDISTTMDIYTKISEKYVLREYSRVFMKVT